MKTKNFLFVCLFMAFASMQLYAQNSNSDGTYTIKSELKVNWMAPIYCEGVQIDLITGRFVDAYIVEHFKDGVSQFKHWYISGLGESTNTDETFTFNEHVKELRGAPQGCHTHLKGNKGNVYNISLYLTTYSTWEVKNATCAGNTK